MLGLPATFWAAFAVIAGVTVAWALVVLFSGNGGK